MKKFLCRLLVFLIPFYFLGGFVGLIYYIGWMTGEFGSFDRIMELQRREHNVLVGMGYNEQNAYYKYKNANYYQAKVIALGTSRVMQFKDDYFSLGFYNCGGAVSGNYDEYLNFVKNLEYTPELIILGLDQWVFNDAWNRNCIKYEGDTPIRMIDRNNVSMECSMIRDMINHKWNMDSINNYPMNYGFNGRIKDNGFRWDGSYYCGSVYQEPENEEDYMFKDTFNRIFEGNRRFEWGDDVDEETYEYLSAFLKYCSENKIKVVGFAPPFAPSVYNQMAASGNYGYLNEISPGCKKMFEEYGYEYFEYTDAKMFNVNDAYFTDGFHGGEVVYAYIVEDMLKQGSCLCDYVDETHLENLLNDYYSELLLKEPVDGDK